MRAHLHGTCVSFDVDDDPNNDLFLHESLVGGGIKAKLLRTLDSLEPKDDPRNRLAIAAKRVLSFRGRELGYFAFIDLLRLLYPEACRVMNNPQS